MPVSQSEVTKWFGGRRIVEAKRPLHIDPTVHDIRMATPNDPNKCVFSRACQREYGSKGVLFLGTVAYVDRNGVVERYMIPPKARLMIRAFDAGYKVKPSKTPEDFTLMPPPFSQTRKQLRKTYSQYLKNKGKRGPMKQARIQPQTARLTKFHQAVSAGAKAA